MLLKICYSLANGSRGPHVVSVEPGQDFTATHPPAFVDRIRRTGVRLREPLNPPPIAAKNTQCFIRRSPIYYDALDTRVVLPQDALNRRHEEVGAVKTGDDYGD